MLMWLAGRAGISEARAYRLKPGSSSGHFSLKVKKVLGWKDRKWLYELHNPGHGKRDLERTIQIVPTIPAHESIGRDLTELEADIELLKGRLGREGGLPPRYYRHPVVQGARDGELVWPIAIYLDGVPYSHTDGVIGWWLINLITRKRYGYAVRRKRIICQCGRRGW